MKDRLSPDEVRSFVFGVEDSIVSTVGLVAGVAAADVGNSTVVLTGTILVVVEAFSMAAGTFLSDTSAHEFEEQREVPMTSSIGSAAVMFFSYIVFGFAVLAPFAFFVNGRAIWWSVGLSLVSLFSLGMLSARISKGRMLQKGLTTLMVGGAAVLIGVIIGTMFK